MIKERSSGGQTRRMAKRSQFLISVFDLFAFLLRYNDWGWSNDL